MSRSVSVPIREAANAVLSIGREQLYRRVRANGGGSLRALAEGVNEMAERLENAHASMARRIDEATAELRARKDEAERANLAKSRFLAAASHDLRQPLHALGLFLSELTQQPLDERSRQITGRLTASTEAMEGLLDSLLDISRLDAGVLTPERSVFDMRAKLEHLVAGQTSAATARGLDLRLLPAPRLSVGQLRVARAGLDLTAREAEFELSPTDLLRGRLHFAAMRLTSARIAFDPAAFVTPQDKTCLLYTSPSPRDS